MRFWPVAATLLLIAGGTNVQAEPLLPELGKKPTTIVCLGDSVTGVYYHTGGQRAYPEMLEIGLRRLYPTAEIKVINGGISGQTTQDGLKRLDKDVLSHKPQLVTISFGLNDVVRVPPEAFRKNLIELSQRSREAGAGVVLCTPIMILNAGGRTVAKVSEYSDIIRSVAKEQQIAVCDLFAVGEAHQKRDAWGWRSTLSDEFHPNMAGHKLMAEELAFCITGQRASLDDVAPADPALAKTWAKLKAGQPVKVLAMPPYDGLIAAALKARFANAQVEVTPWPVAGKTLAEISEVAKTIVRPMKPDLVVLAVPREAEAANDEAYFNAYTWVMNWSLSFGLQEWDCFVVHPAVAAPGAEQARDKLVRTLVKAQHLHLLDRSAIDRTSPAHKLEMFLAEDAIRGATPLYADLANVMKFYDGAGKLQPVTSKEQWQIRAGHALGNMQRVMGPLPAKTTEPVDMQVVSETRLDKYTRQLVSYLAEPGDRAVGYLLMPHAAAGDTAKRPAMICLPESDRVGKDSPAGLGQRPDMGYAHELAERGYVCLVIDYPLRHNREYKTDPYAIGYASCTLKGVVNHRRGVDLLAGLANVDAERIGVIGHSLGGHNALFLAAFEPRIRVIVSSCGFNVFGKHNKGNVAAWSSQYYMPRIKNDYGDVASRIPFDFTEVLAVLAPRPVFINAPLHDDPDFEVSGVYDCLNAARPVYRDLFGAESLLHAEHPDTGHAFPDAQRKGAYEFLEKHLGKK